MQLSEEIIAMIKNEVTNEVNKLVADFTKIKAAVEEKEEKQYKVLAHFTHAGDAIPTHTVKESGVEQAFSQLTNMLNKFHTICDERGYAKTISDLEAEIAILQRKNRKKLNSVNDARLAAINEIEKLKKEKEDLEAYNDQLIKERGREVTVASYCRPKSLVPGAAYTTSNVQVAVDTLVEQIKESHTLYEELKKEIEEIESSAVAFADDVTRSVQQLVSDIQVDFKKKL